MFLQFNQRGLSGEIRIHSFSVLSSLGSCFTSMRLGASCLFLLSLVAFGSCFPLLSMLSVWNPALAVTPYTSIPNPFLVVDLNLVRLESAPTDNPTSIWSLVA